MRIYLICPVEGHSPEETRSIVEDLEVQGHRVHWPPRDTQQDDPTGGLMICGRNRQAISLADMVYVVWNGKSRGSMFDLGMAWAMHKPIKVVGPIEIPSDKSKSLEHLMLQWEALNA